MKDIAFREKELNQWVDLFSQKRVVKFENVGHFIQEEKGAELCPIISDFLSEIVRGEGLYTQAHLKSPFRRLPSAANGAVAKKVNDDHGPAVFPVCPRKVL